MYIPRPASFEPDAWPGCFMGDRPEAGIFAPVRVVCLKEFALGMHSPINPMAIVG